MTPEISVLLDKYEQQSKTEVSPDQIESWYRDPATIAFMGELKYQWLNILSSSPVDVAADIRVAELAILERLINFDWGIENDDENN